MGSASPEVLISASRPGENFPSRISFDDLLPLARCLPFNARPAAGRYSSNAPVSPRAHPMCMTASRGVSFPSNVFRRVQRPSGGEGPEPPRRSRRASNPGPLRLCRLHGFDALLHTRRSRTHHRLRLRSWVFLPSFSDAEAMNRSARVLWIGRPPLLPPQLPPRGLGTRPATEARLATFAVPFCPIVCISR